MSKTETKAHVPQDLLDRRAEARRKRIRNRRFVGGGVLAAMAAAGTFAVYAPANRVVDRVSGLDAALAAEQLPGAPKPNPNVKLESFTFKAEGDNSLTSAIAKYAPTQDLYEAEGAMESYLPQNQHLKKGEQPSSTVYPNETVTFAVDEHTHKILPKDEAPLPPSVPTER